MGKDILTFGNNEIEKNKFCCHKAPVLLGDVDLAISTLLVTCVIIIKSSHCI